MLFYARYEKLDHDLKKLIIHITFKQKKKGSNNYYYYYYYYYYYSLDKNKQKKFYTTYWWLHVIIFKRRKNKCLTQFNLFEYYYLKWTFEGHVDIRVENTTNQKFKNT